MTTNVNTGFGDVDNELTDIDMTGFTVFMGQSASLFGVQVAGDIGLTFGGTTLGGYSGLLPSTGTITSYAEYDLSAGTNLTTTWTGFSITASDFNTWVSTNDAAAFTNAVWGGADAVTGTSFIDTLWGYGGNDLLRGLGGADALDGGAGIDTASYAGSPGGVRVNLATGTGLDNDAQGDTLVNIERLIGSGSGDQLTGNALANRITGGSGNDFLLGAAGPDTLLGGVGLDTINGGVGHDTLTGGASADRFLFNSAVIAANSDTITDYNVADDTIRLEDAVFAALGAPGVLAPAAFFIGAAAADASDRIIYNPGTGALIYDANGNAAGGAVLFATLTAGLALTNADFVVI